ncbi:hypothetical protein COK38_24730 [Bacillus cereus]|uniref:Uncharacterized protein n=1 Tax=Bacillus cereus TaxID=1396 RepID=A0AA44Q655_BACCE|nr:hypothetical protein [Bacillus cereus]PFN04547.1 hypothetical protein COJ55_21120 [Bacillus cereus]PFR89404.1 hypothetical protein COK38_24730 [Bacillus cereus]
MTLAVGVSISTICSAILLIWNSYSFYDEFTTGHTYYWINGVAALLFLIYFIGNIQDIIKKSYTTSK